MWCSGPTGPPACPAQAGTSRGKGGGLSALFVFHINVICVCISGFPGGSVVKNPPASVGYSGSISGLGRCPGGGSGNPLQKWQPTPGFLPGKSHGQGSLAGYSPWVHKELDTTEQLTWSQKLIDLLCCCKL